MSIEDRILDKKVKMRINGKRIEYSLREYCALRDIPENIMLWRYSKKQSPQKLFTRPAYILEYNGKKYTPAMLSELYGVSEPALINRWMKGVRGEKLVVSERPNHPGKPPRDAKAVFAEECRKHLIALCRAHPDMIAHAKKYAVDGHLDPFDEAQARRNAQRLEARGHEVRQQGMELVA